MLFRAQVAAARLAARTSRSVGAGGGTTLPGRLLLALEPDAIGRLSRGLARGSVVISATNGKTTTARMLAAMMSPPYRLSANRAGANLASGIASALLRDDGAADAGLFEVDEAALPRVADQLDPAVLVLGNLFRDQLDRYGELEAIAEHWGGLTRELGPDKVLVRNGDDPLVASLDPGKARVLSFGLDDAAAGLIGIEHAADSKWCAVCSHRLEYASVFLGHLGDWRCPNCGAHRPRLDVFARDLQFEGLDASRFELVTPLGSVRVRVPVPGLYNVYNAVAAAAAACATGVVGIERIGAALEQFDPAFGRFERVTVDDREAVLILVKNPAGANEVVRTLTRDEQKKTLILALNDRIADGRDVSWIWDVDFETLADRVTNVVTTGTRAAEMALRLQYAGLASHTLEVEPDLDAALHRAAAQADGTLYILATYTAMLELRQVLAAHGVVKPFWETA